MKRSKFDETRILAILAQHENGQNVVDICRELSIRKACMLFCLRNPVCRKKRAERVQGDCFYRGNICFHF